MNLTWKQRLTGHADPHEITHHHHVGHYNGMTREAWKASDAHVRYLRDLMTQPMFRDLLAVLSNSRPQALSNPDPTAAAIALGRREGYDLLFGALLDLAEFPPPIPEEVPLTYGSEEFDINRVQ